VCGRYVRRSDKQKIAEYFHANPQPAKLPMPVADYNIAPTTHQPIIRQSREPGEREMVLARWGLVPFFTKDLSDIKEPMKKRRCIIPATAFFEWEKAGKPPKKPYVFELANGNPIGFAGLWDAWKDREGHQSRQCPQ
jgi:putative SOS response-associated peptidase YedK